MRKLLLLLLVILSFSCITGCGKLNSAKKNEDSNTSTVNQTKKEDTSMVFVNSSNSRKCKRINDKETIKKVTDFIDNSEKTSIENRHEVGWYIMINLTTPTGIKLYSLEGDSNGNDTLTIDDSCYKVSKDFVDGIKSLYNEINVQEEKYPNEQELKK